MKYFLLLCVFLPLFAFAFSDIQNSQWKESIEKLEQLGIVQGYTNGTFGPDQTINRAEFLKILLEAKKSYQEDSLHLSEGGKITDYYSDTPEGAWYVNYVLLATQHGITKGYPDNTFRPGSFINYAEAAKIVVQTFELKIESTESQEWYIPFIKTLQIFQAEPRKDLQPSESITRGEMAYMITKIGESFEEKREVVKEEISEIAIPEEKDNTVSPLQVVESSHPGKEIVGGYISDYHQWQKASYGASLENLRPLENQQILSDQILEQLNQARKNEGKDAMKKHEGLQDLAQQFAEHLVINGIYSHTDMLGNDPFERAAGIGYNAFIAESMVWKKSDPLTAIDWWKNSALHWRNISDPTFINAGVGIAQEPTGSFIVILLQGR